MSVVGARPNFVKVAPVVSALARYDGVRQRVVHTGQHYDARLSGEVLADLDFPEPHALLNIGSGTHAEQTGRTMIAFERILLDERPDMVLVAGDVNSTLAAALAASKLHIPVAHLESGLRSGDWTMPEEVNRVLTDRLSAHLFTTSPEAADNLAREGIDNGSVHFVGNTMIDSLRRCETAARKRAMWRLLGVEAGSYVLVTLHRPSNVDDPDQLAGIVEALLAIGRAAPVLFPVHPRTRVRLDASDQLERLERGGVYCLEPLGYLDFLSLQCGAGAIVTDSGGVQEEASALGVPCYTLRPNTERPITISHGTNVLLGDDPRLLAGVRPSGRAPEPRELPLWDGNAGERVAELLASELTGAEAALGAAELL